MKNIIFVFLFFSAVFGLSGCKNSGQLEQEQAGLLRQTKELEQRHCQIKASVDSLWDTTTTQLDRVLPPDFPPVDRDIFLKARNADHIRMFLSFQKLGPDVQSLVNEAGRQDERLAAQIRALLTQKLAFEQQKNQFLQKVAQKDLNLSRMYTGQFRAEMAQACQEAPNHSLK